MRCVLSFETSRPAAGVRATRVVRDGVGKPPHRAKSRGGDPGAGRNNIVANAAAAHADGLSQGLVSDTCYGVGSNGVGHEATVW
jgi:hypothetical protein